MREAQFIKRNLDRWEEYKTPTDDPDEVAKRFTYLVDDLSYGKTFYPGSNTNKYINSIAAKIYLSIYRNKKEKKGRIGLFFKTELPLVIQRNQKQLLYSLLFFLFFIALGVFSASQDQGFVRAILGDGYVDMTEQNIAEGHPFAVYASESPMAMFMWIAFNNISVSFQVYIMGLFLGVGTVYHLMKNGLMMGVFEYMFFHHNLGWRSILVIFIHGTLELSSIVVAGGTGLMLGNSILFPKTFTRMQSFLKAAKDSIKITIALVPVYIVAAFFESFVTRHTEMPLPMSLAILIGSAAFIVWYFIIYPIKVSKRTIIDVEA